MLISKLISQQTQEISVKRIPNIIIITLSGLRNKDSIEEPEHQYITNLWNKMFREGVIYTNLIDYNLESHMPVIDAINTGITYSTRYRTIKPTIFQYVRKKYKLPVTKLWIIGAWSEGDCYYKDKKYSNNTYPGIFSLQIVHRVTPELRKILTKQELLALGGFKNLGKLNLFIWPHWEVTGKMHFQILKKIMQRFQPILVHYVLDDIEVAHYDTFGHYLLTLKNSDEVIFEIWKLIKEDNFYKDNSYLIVSPDHERNLYYMGHDDNPPENPSKVWMYVYGPDVKRGVIINRPVYHTDIFATIACLFNVATHPNEGSILEDCFLQESEKGK